MTPQEEKRMLLDKIKQYEQLLDELTDSKVKKEGKVLAQSQEGFYKVKTSSEEIIAKSPAFKPKVGESVIIMEGTIFSKLPESLVSIEEEAVEFKRIKWENIGGMKSQIDEIRRKIEYPIKYANLYREFNLPESKGILLHGEPGCGKTLIAKAIASTMLNNIKINRQIFTYLKGGELLSKYVGETENRVKNIFDSARKTLKETNVRPIIFIDEAEAILPPRGSRTSSDVEMTIVPTFLSEMDGFEGNNPFIILATNYLEMIDIAIQRPGRIDLKIYIGRPDLEDSIDIFKIHLSKTKLTEDVNKLSKIAANHLFSVDKLKGEISGALIENIVNLSIETAIVRKINNSNTSVGVGVEDLIKSINYQ
jgi:proteasome-associated ATPase